MAASARPVARRAGRTAGEPGCCTCVTEERHDNTVTFVAVTDIAPIPGESIVGWYGPGTDEFVGERSERAAQRFHRLAPRWRGPFDVGQQAGHQLKAKAGPVSGTMSVTTGRQVLWRTSRQSPKHVASAYKGPLEIAPVCHGSKPGVRGHITSAVPALLLARRIAQRLDAARPPARPAALLGGDPLAPSFRLIDEIAQP